MASDAEITLAFVAKRQGRDAMAASEWAHVMSLELGWMAPGAAKGFVADCEGSGLLVASGDALALGFDRRAVTVPNRFRPPADMATAPPSVPAAEPESETPSDASGPADRFPALVARIAEERSLEKSEVLDEVSAVQDRFGGRLSADAAVIRVAMAHGLDVADEASSALADLKSA